MTKPELVARLRDIEWDDFEVKAAKSELPKNIWETMSAFSNTSGGWIVRGVKQSRKSFEIQGVDNREKLEQDFLGKLPFKTFNKFISAYLHRYSIDRNNKPLSINFYQRLSDSFRPLKNTVILMNNCDKITENNVVRIINLNGLYAVE